MMYSYEGHNIIYQNNICHFFLYVDRSSNNQNYRLKTTETTIW